MLCFPPSPKSMRRLGERRSFIDALKDLSYFVVLIHQPEDHALTMTMEFCAPCALLLKNCVNSKAVKSKTPTEKTTQANLKAVNDMDERDEIIRKINNLRSSINYNSSECIADFVLADRLRILEKIERPLNNAISYGKRVDDSVDRWKVAQVYEDCISEALSIIERMKKG